MTLYAGYKYDMYIYAIEQNSGNYGGGEIVIYDYRETRQKKHPQEFLNGFREYLQTDGFS